MADVTTVINNLQRRFSRALTARDMKALGNLAVKRIQQRTRSGKGVRKTGGNERSFKELSTQYIQFRKRSKLDATTSATTSNLTFSGSMLRSLKVVTATTGTGGKAKLIVGPSGKKNIKKAGYVSVVRPFMNLSKKDVRDIIELMTRRIKTNVSRR